MVPYAPIDPMALILPGRTYLAYLEAKQPHVPATEAFRQVLDGMSAEERAAAAQHARRLLDYGRAVQALLEPQPYRSAA